MVRRMISIFGIVMAIMVVGSIAFNVYIFSDCIADGKRAYQCNAAIQNPVYVGVDKWE